MHLAPGGRRGSSGRPWRLLSLIVLVATTAMPAQAQPLSASAQQQIQAIQAEKASRTPAQRKIGSGLLHEIRRQRGDAILNGLPRLRTGVTVERDGRVHVDITARVASSLLDQIRAAGGSIEGSYPRFETIRARLPLDAIEALAARSDVRFVRPAALAMTNKVNTSEGDVAHGADVARIANAVDGTGVQIGVLSDSVDFLAASQASGDLPPVVNVLPGQAGSGSGEGTAMLEIVYDLAPGADLYFATAFSGVAGFAQNILDLEAAGCDVIVDDVFYFGEPVFEDGPIAQSVNTVAGLGAQYYSSAGNSGNLNDGQSGVWEGDFAPIAAPAVIGGVAHDFGGGNNSNVLTVDSPFFFELQWADKFGASANDYDLYLLDPSGTSVLASSTDVQAGTGDPLEGISSQGYNDTNSRLVIIQNAGADARFLNLTTHRGRLALATDGQTRGHSATYGAFGVAAVDAATAGGSAFTGGGANPVETFSSDGFRQRFYDETGAAITPGDFTSTGGTVLQKPDMTAADGVATAVPGFNPFYGTSAAAPHAAAIGALVLQKFPGITLTELRTLYAATALDIEAPGFDRDSGVGIIMADRALAYTPGEPDLVVTVFEGPCCTFHGDEVGANILCSVRNVGTADIVDPFAVGFYVSTDPLITVADELLDGGREFVPGLAQGAEVVVPLSALAAIPAPAPTGEVFLGVIVDELQDVPESDELNNTASQPVSLGTDEQWCARAMVETAAAPLRVSVYTRPDGGGRALNAAQHWDGVAGNPPVDVDATIVVMISDGAGNPVPGVELTLLTSHGGLVFCPGGAKSDAPTDAAGITTFSQAVFGGGSTDPGTGEVTRIGGLPGTGAFAEVLYGEKVMAASDQQGNIYVLDLGTGAGTLVCNLGLEYSTEIEHYPPTGRAFAQAVNGNYTGVEFDIFSCAPLGSVVPTNGLVFNGLEWLGDQLYGTAIPDACQPSELRILDPTTGGSVLVGSTWDRPISGLAFDPVCRDLYGVTGCSSVGPADLIRIDPATGAGTFIGNTQLQLGALEFGPDRLLYAGGGQAEGGNLWILDPETGAGSVVGPTGMLGVTGLALVSDPGLDVQFNSADINGDLVVNLIDVSDFSIDFNAGYQYRSDFHWDGHLNLVDVSRLAEAIGATCPGLLAKGQPQLASQGEIGLCFDPAGQVRTLDAAPNTDVTAYVLVTGKAAASGVSAFELKLETSDNVVVGEWTLPEGALDFGKGAALGDGPGPGERSEHVVGLGREIEGASGQPLQLASVRLRVTDDQPARLYLRPTSAPSLGGDRLAVVVGGESAQLASVDVASVTEDGAAAALNDVSTSGSTSTVFTGVQLRNQPNPFNPVTEIRFNLPRRGRGEVRIYDVSGRQVRSLGDGVLAAGANVLRWNGTDRHGASVVSGVYFYRLFLDGEQMGGVVKMTLLK